MVQSIDQQGVESIFSLVFTAKTFMIIFMKRFGKLVLLFLLAACPAFAAAGISEDTPVTLPLPVSEAKPVTPAPSPANIPLDELEAWLAIPPQDRAVLVEQWQNMPETTRPPFPIYRARLFLPSGALAPGELVKPDPATETVF